MGFATAEWTLAAAVASPAGTVAIGYPSGTVQADFTSANASATSYLLLNDNDRFEEADDEFDISFGASTITITNKTGATWPIGTKITLQAANAGSIDPADLITIDAITSFTDNSTGTAGATIAAGAGVQTVAIPLQLASMTTAAADLMTNYVPGFRFKVLSVEFVTTKLGTGASASQVLNLEIGSTNLTGGVLTLLLADTDTLGKKTAATAVTAANVGTATDTLSVEVATSGTVFTAGEGFLLVKIQNMDTADAIASLLAKFNTLLVGLRASGLLET